MFFHSKMHEEERKIDFAPLCSFFDRWNKKEVEILIVAHHLSHLGVPEWSDYGIVSQITNADTWDFILAVRHKSVQSNHLWNQQ